MVSLAFSLFASPDAQAGTYVWQTKNANGNVTAQSPTYSGGTITAVGKSPAAPSPTFSPNDGQYIGASSVSATNYESTSTTCSIKVTGTLTATFTWQPAAGMTSTTDPPPTAVIAEQHCTVGWSTTRTDGTGSGSGTGNTGLPETTTSGSQPSGSSQAADYAASSGGASFSVSCSPTLDYEGNCGGASYSDIQAQASVQYYAVPYPVVVGVGGTTPDSSQNPNILVGQQATGTVSVVTPIPPPYNQPSGCTLSGFQWNPSGTTFESWTVSSDQSHTTEVDATPATNPTQWYWNDASNATETVSCTVTVTPPAGQGSPFTLTATALKPVSVVIPSCTFDQFEGAVSIMTTPDEGTVLKASGLSQTHPYGETWVCKVMTPSLFGVGGSYNLCQVITPGRSHTYTSGAVVCTQNNIQGLDAVIPYASALGDPYTINTQGGSNAGWPADNSQHQTGDAPDTEVSDAKLGNAESISVNETFFTTLMYTPPGSGQRVPIILRGWDWDASPSEPAGGWLTEGSTILGTVNSTPTSGTNVFPIWTLIESTSVGSGW